MVGLPCNPKDSWRLSSPSSYGESLRAKTICRAMDSSRLRVRPVPAEGPCERVINWKGVAKILRLWHRDAYGQLYADYVGQLQQHLSLPYAREISDDLQRLEQVSALHSVPMTQDLWQGWRLLQYQERKFTHLLRLGAPGIIMQSAHRQVRAAQYAFQHVLSMLKSAPNQPKERP